MSWTEQTKSFVLIWYNEIRSDASSFQPDCAIRALCQSPHSKFDHFSILFSLQFFLHQRYLILTSIRTVINTVHTCKPFSLPHPFRSCNFVAHNIHVWTASNRELVKLLVCPMYTRFYPSLLHFTNIYLAFNSCLQTSPRPWCFPCKIGLFPRQLLSRVHLARFVIDKRMNQISSNLQLDGNQVILFFVISGRKGLI